MYLDSPRPDVGEIEMSLWPQTSGQAYLCRPGGREVSKEGPWTPGDLIPVRLRATGVGVSVFGAKKDMNFGGWGQNATD